MSDIDVIHWESVFISQSFERYPDLVRWKKQLKMILQTCTDSRHITHKCISWAAGSVGTVVGRVQNKAESGWATLSACLCAHSQNVVSFAALICGTGLFVLQLSEEIFVQTTVQGWLASFCRCCGIRCSRLDDYSDTSCVMIHPRSVKAQLQVTW